LSPRRRDSLSSSFMTLTPLTPWNDRQCVPSGLAEIGRGRVGGGEVGRSISSCCVASKTSCAADAGAGWMWVTAGALEG
jgi:hypothetical protein